MFTLLKKLFSTRDGDHTVVIIKDDGSKPSSSHRVNPAVLWSVSIGAALLLAVLLVALLRFTPMGKLVYNQDEIRDTVLSIQQKVASLQDTLEARNIQLNQMKRVIASGDDTTFEISRPLAVRGGAAGAAESTPSGSGSATSSLPPLLQDVPVRRLPADAVLITRLLDERPEFPAPSPLDGTSTRRFNTTTGHYGLDIAATNGTPFRAVADGVIINQEWTFNYGYVIVMQHAGGLITLYKHAQTIDKATGEVVRQGEILGTIGDIGILSSGPHLHIEIWENGIPQDPENFLTEP